MANFKCEKLEEQNKKFTIKIIYSQFHCQDRAKKYIFSSQSINEIDPMILWEN